MAAYTGVGTRIREQMIKRGYVRTDGEPDVQRFCWDLRYDRTLIYAWLSDKATPFKDLIRLARDLQISVEWLLTGQERATVGKEPRRQGRRPLASLLLAWALGGGGLFGWPSSGGAVAEAGALPVAYVVDFMLLLRHWLRDAFRPVARRVQLLGCPA